MITHDQVEKLLYRIKKSLDLTTKIDQGKIESHARLLKNYSLDTIRKAREELVSDYDGARFPKPAVFKRYLLLVKGDKVDVPDWQLKESEGKDREWDQMVYRHKLKTIDFKDRIINDKELLSNQVEAMVLVNKYLNATFGELRDIKKEYVKYKSGYISSLHGLLALYYDDKLDEISGDVKGDVQIDLGL